MNKFDSLATEHAQICAPAQQTIVPLRRPGGYDPLRSFVFEGDAPIDPPRMLVKGLLPFEGIAFIGGQSGRGKDLLGGGLWLSPFGTETPFFGRPIS